MKFFLSLVFSICLLSSHTLWSANASRSDSIDIRKTIIEMDILDFSSKNINAKATISIRSKQNNINQVLFDLEGLTVDSVWMNGTSASFNHIGQTLTVINNITLQNNDTALYTIFYHGVPISDATWGGFSFVGNYAFQMGVGFNAQPHSFGRTWHPCFDNFVERTPYEFFITTQNDKMAVCNGLFIDSSTTQNNEKIWHWKLDEEIPSYLASVSVSQYVWVTQTLNGMQGSKQALLACQASDTSNVKGSFANLQDSYTMLESRFGPYQWSRVGFTLVPFNAGAMEHATNIHIGIPYIDGTLSYQTLIAHELSHHWWGDLVTCSSAEDMWLNEGFASYCEMLHTEQVSGYNSYIDDYKSNHYQVLSSAHINDDGYKAVSPIDSLHTYGTTVYNKGADMLHTLRSYLGENLFFASLKAFIDSNKFKSISTQQLSTFLTSYTGKNMQPFFDDWILSPGFPHFSIDSQQVKLNNNLYEVHTFLRQRKHHNTHYFQQVPMEIGFYDAQWNLHIYTLHFINQCMDFFVKLPFEPVLTVLDPNYKLSDAISDEEQVIKSVGTKSFSQAKCNAIIKTVTDSSFLRIEHHWVAPDRFKQNANGYVLHNNRYWNIQTIDEQNIEGLLQFRYDAFAPNQFLDSNWLKNTEDSIHIFYRKNSKEDWAPIADSLQPGSITDRRGNIYAKTIKAGEYCLGIKRSLYTDIMQSEIALGACTLVTQTQQIQLEDAKPSYSIFPNPTHTYFKVLSTDNSNQDSYISLKNQFGVTIWEKKLELNQAYNTANLPSGFYFIEIKNQTNKLYTNKLCIMN
ncbi:MAG: M1 family aminopeptidase [Chitinophagaceae bacterium]